MPHGTALPACALWPADSAYPQNFRTRSGAFTCLQWQFCDPSRAKVLSKNSGAPLGNAAIFMRLKTLVDWWLSHLVLKHFAFVLITADLDGARFERFGNFQTQIDVQEAVFKVRPFHNYMFS